MKKPPKSAPKWYDGVSEYLAEIGRKGGKAKGAGKRRGGKAYYQAIARKRWAKEKPT